MLSKRLVNTILFVLLIFMAVFARMYQFGELPTSLNRDEAALAYTAWSLLETGRDEWGERWPLAPASFGDYKLIGYPTLLVGLFCFLPKADWVVRLPSLLAGVGLVAISWEIGRKLFNQYYGYVLAALVATNPVFIWFSRSAWEANVALFYLITAGYLIFSAFNQTKFVWRLPVGLLLLLMSMLTYNTPLILIPVLALLLPFLINGKQFKTTVLTSVITLLLVGVVFLLLSPVWSQKSGITIFTDATVHAEWLEFRSEFNEPWQSIIGNRYLYLLARVAQNFIGSFSTEFVVFRGGAHPWHTLPGFGHLLLVVYLLALFEVFTLLVSFVTQFYQQIKLRSKNLDFRKDFQQQYVWLVLLPISLLPALVTVDAPHATRSLLFFWLLCLLAVRFLWRHKNQKRLLPTSLLIVVLSLANYIYQYFSIYPAHSADIFQSGFKTVLNQVETAIPNQPVAIVDPGGYQYVLLAWYLPVHPTDYLAHNTRQLPNQIGLRYGERVGRFHFIANIRDRAATEQVVIYWDEEQESWIVEPHLL